MKRIAVLSLILLFAMAGASMAADKKINQGSGYVGVATGLALANPFAAAAGMGANNTVSGGYFVIDGLEIGGILSLDYNKMATETTPDGGDATTVTNSSSLFGIGAQLAYFFDAGSILAPYAQLGLEYAMWSATAETEPPAGDTQTEEDSGSGIVVMPRFGLAFFITKNFALDTSLYFSYFTSMSGEDETWNAASGEADVTDVEMSNMDLGFMMGLNFFF